MTDILVGDERVFRTALRVRPRALVATSVPRDGWLARLLGRAFAPEAFDVCPVLLVHPGGDGVEHVRRFFDRLRVPKRLVIGWGSSPRGGQSPASDAQLREIARQVIGAAPALT